MTGREFKDLTFEHFAKIANAFSSPKRLEIIDLLSQGEKDVDTLAKETNMNFANASRHLQLLKSANIAKSRKEGIRVIYSLSTDEVIVCWKNLQNLAEKTVAELRDIAKSFMDERLALESISASELHLKIHDDDIIVIDVRPKEEFLNGHIPGAVSIPLAELNEKIKDLPAGKEIVAYCRGKYCVLAAEASKMLSSEGFKTTIMKDDVNSWRFAGLEVERNSK
jgi:rhodanese-related sulfurtransferase/predicted transcriptional regulator